MKKAFHIGGFLFMLYATSIWLACNVSKAMPTNEILQPIAFPSAEGFGKYTTGGRGGEIFIVNNLNDKGEGSFRKAATHKGAKIIVFTVSGTIHLESPLTITANTTIAGQTAPGDGIAFADYPVGLGGDNIIIRYLRFRLGDKNQNKGKVDGSGHDDAFGASRRKHIIIDHCSFSWSTDECISVYGGDSTTLQWNLIAEPLNYSYHFEAGGTDYQRHGYGGIWGGTHLTAHHNLFAHCQSRTPRFNGLRLGSSQELVDFRNNVIYNWGGNNIYGGEEGMYNLVNNYYKFGPNTNKNVKNRIVNPSLSANQKMGQWFVAGNFVESFPEVSKQNFLGVHITDKNFNGTKEDVLVKKSFAVAEIKTETAAKAFQQVMANVGASYRRDSMDERIINDVKNRTGKIIDVQGGFEHGTPYSISKNAWPNLKSTIAPKDSDKDGIPDEWEISHRLNPLDPTDAAQKAKNNFYTNIELYINSIVL